jgi:branched-chain amino acid transport system ATP-binding protein
MESMPDTPLLAVRNVSLRFGGVVALDAVSFDILAGQIVGLIGPNGAGKTSLFNAIGRLYQPDSGRIVFDGHDLLRLRMHEVVGLGITRTFQNVALFSSMSVLDNVLVGEHAHRQGARAFASALRLVRARSAERRARERALAALDSVDLRAIANVACSSLPLGTQKRVELARALVSQPRLLLLDEPAGGLNQTEVAEFGELIRHIHRVYGLTLLLVEHHMNLVMGISDQVVVLNFGRKIADGPPQLVQSNPGVIEAYLGAVAAA